MPGFRVGLIDTLAYTSIGPLTMTRANYLTAVAAGVDSFQVADHLNALPHVRRQPDYQAPGTRPPE